MTEFRVDALRLDAVHGIFDFSALHFLQELACAVNAQAEQLNRRIYVIAESDLNDARLVRLKNWVVMAWTPNGTTISIMRSTRFYQGANRVL